MVMMMSSWISVLCVWHGCFRRAFWRSGVRKNATESSIYCTWNSFPNQGVPERYAVPWKTSQKSRVLPQQFRLDDRRGWILCPFKTAPGSAGSFFLNVHNRALFFLFHSVFGQPTASFFLAHPYMENPTCEEGFRRSFSSGAERAGASAHSGASVRDWGRRSEDKPEDASAPSISSNKRGKWRRGWTRDAGRRRWHQHQHHRRPCDTALQCTDDDAWTSLHTNIYRCEAWIINM